MFNSPFLASLLDDQLMPLGPGTPREAFRAKLAAVKPAALFGSAIVRPESAQACIAGLWLRHNFLDESHRISQDLPSAEGSYWHAIMHRREPDYWNSKYWFRRVGRHPIYTELPARAETFGGSPLLPKNQWDADAFVDLCEANAAPNAAAHEFCRKLQQAEWGLLFAHCWREAIEE
ncbi:MAG: hypothetical protein U0744_15230 [Gemmataceae bacterium]